MTQSLNEPEKVQSMPNLRSAPSTPSSSNNATRSAPGPKLTSSATLARGPPAICSPHKSEHFNSVDPSPSSEFGTDMTRAAITSPVMCSPVSVSPFHSPLASHSLTSKSLSPVTENCSTIEAAYMKETKRHGSPNRDMVDHGEAGCSHVEEIIPLKKRKISVGGNATKEEMRPQSLVLREKRKWKHLDENLAHLVLNHATPMFKKSKPGSAEPYHEDHTAFSAISMPLFMSVATPLTSVVPLCERGTTDSTDYPLTTSSSTTNMNGLHVASTVDRGLTVHIDPLMGDSFAVELLPGERLGDMKLGIFEQTGVFPEKQVLLFHDEPLHTKPDGYTVADVGLTNHCRVKLLVRLSGGPGPITAVPSSLDIAMHSASSNNLFFVDPPETSASGSALIYKLDGDEMIMIEILRGEDPQASGNEDSDDDDHHCTQQDDHIERNIQQPFNDEELAPLNLLKISPSPQCTLLTASASPSIDMARMAAVCASPGPSSTPPSPPSPSATVRLKCALCYRKLRLTNGFQCRCGLCYCSEHRYSDRHLCTFDFHAKAKADLAKEHPIVVKERLQKL